MTNLITPTYAGLVWPPNPGPITQIQPFTYEDGITYTELLYAIKKYLEETIYPAIAGIVVEVDAAILKLINDVSEALANEQIWVTGEINELKQYVDDQVQLIINDSIQVQDPVVAGIMGDSGSQTRAATDPLYANKATQNTVETGRLADSSLQGKYAVYRDWDVVTNSYPDRVPGAKNLFFGAANPGSKMAESDEWFPPSASAPPISSFVSNGWKFTERWRPVVADVRAGTRSAKGGCLGDSTTQGIGVAGAIPALESYPSEMARRMVSLVAPTVYGLTIPPSDNRPDSDSRWSLGAGWARATEAGIGLGGRQAVYKAGPNSGPLTFVDGRVNASTYDVYYTMSGSASNAGTFTLDCGGTIVTVSTFNATNGVGKATVTGPASVTRGVSIATTDDPGSVWILGIEPHDNSARFRIGNLGVSASSAQSWLTTRAEGDVWNVFGFLPVYDPDFIIIDLGINDAPGSDPVAFGQRIKRLADAAYATGAAVLLKTMIPSQGERGEVEKQYVAEIKTLGYPVLDIYNYYGSWERTNAAGMMFDWGHGNDLMYEDEGRVVAEFLLQYA